MELLSARVGSVQASPVVQPDGAVLGQARRAGLRSPHLSPWPGLPGARPLLHAGLGGDCVPLRGQRTVQETSSRGTDGQLQEPRRGSRHDGRPVEAPTFYRHGRTDVINDVSATSVISEREGGNTWKET